MRLLTLDTATEACSCALYCDGQVRERSLIAPRRHAELILGMADELLAEAGLTPRHLDAVAFGRGPGSFTGLRIACGVAQGIAFAVDIPVVPVSSLAALAQEAQAESGARHVLTAIDARMGELYWGIYQAGAEGLMQAVGQECVATAEAVPLPADGKWLGVGSGWACGGEVLRARLGPALRSEAAERYPQARALIPLALAALARGEAVAAEQALPVYLRNQVAHPPAVRSG